MDRDVLALIGGSFRNSIDKNRKIEKGCLLGEIVQFGTATPVTSECDGEVIWIRENGKVRTNDKLYVIVARTEEGPVVIAAVAGGDAGAGEIAAMVIDEHAEPHEYMDPHLDLDEGDEEDDDDAG